MPSIGLSDIAPCASFQGCVNEICRCFLSYKQDFRLRRKLSNLSCCFDPILPRQPDVQQNQFWFKFAHLLNGFQTIRNFTDNLYPRPALHRRRQKATEERVILCNENSDWAARHIYNTKAL